MFWFSSAGDAAHSFPPTGGLGLNCGLADVHNLAYKVASVHREVASPSILSTYTAERRGVADSYSKQSVKNGKEIFALLQSLKTAGVEDVAQARRNMMDALADPAQHAKIVAGIEGQREHFDNVSAIVFLSPMPLWTMIFDILPYSWSFILGMCMERANLLFMPRFTLQSLSRGHACPMLGSNLLISRR
jgi:hypothetical protein